MPRSRPNAPLVSSLRLVQVRNAEIQKCNHIQLGFVFCFCHFPSLLEEKKKYTAFNPMSKNKQKYKSSITHAKSLWCILQRRLQQKAKLVSILISSFYLIFWKKINAHCRHVTFTVSSLMWIRSPKNIELADFWLQIYMWMDKCFSHFTLNIKLNSAS